jgi:hypothetical protein
MKSSRHETLQPPLQAKANLRTKFTCCKHTDMECWRELRDQMQWEAPGRLILSLRKVRPRPWPLNPKPSNKCRLYKLMLKLETLHTQVIDQDNKGYKSQPNYLGSLVSSNVGCTQVPPLSRTFSPNHSMLSPPDSGFHLALHNKMRTRSTGDKNFLLAERWGWGSW